MANIINAIINLVSSPKYELMEYSKNHNRANAMGDALEEYVKDLFADTVSENDTEVRLKKIQQAFSYLGNSNNPPDSILKGGDAIEVKKIESKDASLALNSSYPKHKLYSDSPMISKACKNCEKWDIKDIMYIVGVVKGNNILSLAMVYGTEYCADKEIYERIRGTIKEGVNSIPDVEFAETNELGRVNKVDPLGITYLRIRGMWGIENPFTVFNYIYQRDDKNKFNFMAIINKEKYDSFKNKGELEKICKTNPDLKIEDKQIKDPNNPANLIDVKLITFRTK